MAALAKGHCSRILVRIVLSGQLPLWRRIRRKDRTWRWSRDGRKWKCIGCGEDTATHKHTYCAACKKRLEAGLPLDLDDYITETEVRALRKRIPDGDFRMGGRHPLEKGRT